MVQVLHNKLSSNFSQPFSAGPLFLVFIVKETILQDIYNVGI